MNETLPLATPLPESVPVVPGPQADPVLSPPGGARRRALTGLGLVAVIGAGVPVALGLALTTAESGQRQLAVRAVEASGPPEEMESRLRRAEETLRSLRFRGTFVAVDTYANRLRVHRGDEILRDATCSTGSGLALRDPRNGRLWVFSTPLGVHTVQRKAVDPVWVKPDWAFVEEGKEPPPLGSRDRYDDFSLGDYALYLGDGYLIHGTIFQTLLGRRVTHGCIRLGDEDLEYVYRQVPVGARVVLY